MVFSPFFLMNLCNITSIMCCREITHGHNLPAVKKDNFVFNLLSFLVLRFPSPDMAQHFHSCGEFLRFFLPDSFLKLKIFFSQICL